MGRAINTQRLQPVITPDAMFDMDDQIPGLNGRQLGDEFLPLTAAAGRTGQTFPQNIRFAEHLNRIRFKARIQWHQANRGLSRGQSF